MAETYHIYDYKSYPGRLIAILAIGLRDDSRIKMKLAKSKLSISDTLLASVVDRLSILVWQKTKDGKKGVNKPRLILDEIANNKSKDKLLVFSSGAKFDEYRASLLFGGKEVNGNVG